MLKGKRTQPSLPESPAQRGSLLLLCAVQLKSEYRPMFSWFYVVRREIRLPAPAQPFCCVARESQTYGFWKEASRHGGNSICQ